MSATSVARDKSPHSVQSKVLATFSQQGVRIVFQNRAEETSYDERAKYISAQRQCLARILSSPHPKRFELQTTGSVADPVAQVLILQKELVEELPVLHVASETGSGLDNEHTCDEAMNPVDMSVPCSVWGLVSLLLVVDGCVSVDKILHDSNQQHESAAARLPIETLEVRACSGSAN